MQHLHRLQQNEDQNNRKSLVISGGSRSNRLSEFAALVFLQKRTDNGCKWLAFPGTKDIDRCKNLNKVET
jgi:hypothetical protein